MTDNTFAEDLKQDARTATEQISVAGGELIKTIQSLLREAAVRKITVQDKNGRTLVEFPLYAGVLGAFFVGSWTVLALIAAWFAEVSILIERDVASDDVASDDVASDDVDSDGEPSAAAEAMGRAAGSVSSAASNLGATLGSAIGSAAHAAGDLARRAADSLEGRMAAGEQAAEAIIEAAEEAAAEPSRCIATTKSGTRCKRTAVAGSEYCSVHAPKA